jgi:hypothetical protein
MSVILQVNVNYDSPEVAANQGTVEQGKELEFLPGLQWKVWLIDKETFSGGGIYLFESKEAAQAWEKDAIRILTGTDGLRNVTTHIFDIIESPSRITRAPLDVAVPTPSPK